MIDVREVNKGRTYKIGPKQQMTVTAEDIIEGIEGLKRNYTFAEPYHKDQIYDVEHLNQIVNALAPGKTMFIGTMFGIELAVTHRGEFVFKDGEIHLPVDVKPVVNLDVCKHRGFISRDIQGEFRYLCGECGKRFRRHPWTVTELDELFERRSQELGLAMEDFRKGILTLTKAVNAANVSVNSFKEFLKKSYPPKFILEPIHTIGGGVVGHTVVGCEPQRRSDPEEFEILVANPKVSGADKIKVIKEVYGDVTGFKRWEDMASRNHIMMFDFVDDTKQRVEISDFDLAWARTELLNQQGMRVNLDYPLIFGGLS